MADHAHLTPIALQPLECLERRIEGVRIQGAESLIQKEGLDGHAARAESGKSERERQRHEEAFPSGKGLDRPPLIRAPAILDLELKLGEARLRVDHGPERIAVPQLLEVPVGLDEEAAEVLRLGKLPKVLAVVGTDEVAQAKPGLRLDPCPFIGRILPFPRLLAVLLDRHLALPLRPDSLGAGHPVPDRTDARFEHVGRLVAQEPLRRTALLVFKEFMPGIDEVGGRT